MEEPISVFLGHLGGQMKEYCRMKISELDRRRAIWRLPEFQKDYELYEAIISTDDIIKKEIELEKKWEYPITKIVSADVVKHVPAVRPVISISEVNEAPHIIVTKENGEGENECEKRLAGDYLYLKVDLNQTLENIESDFKSIIRKYKALLENDSKERETQISLGSSGKTIWDIYDMRNNQNMKFTQITQEVFQVVGALGSKNKIAELPKSLYDQIRYAFKKAEEIIKVVRNEFNLDISKI